MRPHRVLTSKTPIAVALNCLVGAGLGLALPTVAQAQQSAPSEPSTGALDTVIVTAQKRPQLMQQVPVAMSVVSTEEITNRGVAGFSELLSQMPNTIIEQNTSSQPIISIRGITSSTNNIGMESGVGVVVDDVFLGRPSAFSTQLIDIERVEVLRGSQGTLFGKNTIGGLINVVTAKPSRTFDGAADLTIGSYGLRQMRGYLTGGLTDGLATKLSFTSKQRDGWVENRTAGAQDLMSEDFKGVRFQLLGEPSRDVSWLLSAEYSKDAAVENYYDIRSGNFSMFDPNGADRSIATNGNDDYGRTIKGTSLKVNWKAAGLDWVSISAYRSVDWFGVNDQDYTELPILTLGRTEDQSQLSQEFRVSGATDKLNWLAGLYLFRQKQDGVDNMTLGEATPDAFGLGSIPGYTEASDTLSNLKTNSAAVFGSGSYKLSTSLDLNAGLRYTKEDKEMRYSQRLTQSIGLIQSLAAEVTPFTATRSDASWSGDIGFGYQFSKDVNSYVKLSRGFKAGGFTTTSSASSNPGDLSFEPESVTSYELGLKTVLAGGKVRLNAAIFSMDYKDKQEQFFDGVNQVIANAAKAKIDGVEFDLTARPIAGLTLGAALGYQNPRYVSYAGYDGNQLINAPRFTASLSAQYQQTLSNGWRWLVRADARHRGLSYQQADNDSLYAQPANNLLDLSFGLRDPDSRYSVLLWVKNATNKTYRSSTYSINTFGTLYESVNAPRMVGIEFRANL